MKKVTELLNISAKITKSIGDIELDNGIYLRDAILINDISLWDVAETTIALHIIPEIISSRQKKFYLIKKYFFYFLNKLFFLLKKNHISLNLKIIAILKIFG